MFVFKRLNLILLLFFSQQSFAQVSYNYLIKSAYDSVFSKLDARLINMVNNPENKIRGVALLKSFRLDTLNKEDIIAKKKTSRDTTTLPGYQKEKLLFPDVMIGRAKAKGDTLLISISPWFMQGETLKHIVSKTSNTSVYELWNREDKLFQLAGSSSIEEKPRIGGSARIVLSDAKFIPGKTIYGTANFVSDEYHQLQAQDFKGGKVRLRIAYDYVFKFFIQKDEGID
jgi:hypothetical protein